ncbi:MAG: hypothetical protein HRT44_02090 [Bdellovibrionales bacterium]|nr:hypothetical protein [Bdellovibrionales bacterium]NQZ18037.1 hypothetical protein [Bdellovibrionales bacterium]
MIKKIVVAGLCVVTSGVSNASQENNAVNSDTANDLMDSMGALEKEICGEYLSLEEIVDKSATEIADHQLYQSLLNKLSDSPVEYCQEKVLLSVVRWEDDNKNEK